MNEENSATQKMPERTPGWNDPPLLNYSQEQPRTKTQLKKRLAFPSGPSADTVTTENNTEGGYRILDALYNNSSAILEKISSGNEEVKEKVDMLKTQWKRGDFPENYQVLLNELFCALDCKTKSKANELHLKLLMMNANLSKNWISAIRLMISDIADSQ